MTLQQLHNLFVKYCDKNKIGNAVLNLFKDETGAIVNDNKTIFGFANINELINELK